MNRSSRLRRTVTAAMAGSAPVLLLAGCLPAQLATRTDHYCAAGEISAEAAGLRWQECPVQPGVEQWRQAEACFGHLALGQDGAERDGRRRTHPR